MTGRPYVSFDPAVDFGGPTISGASVETVAGMVWAGDSVDETAGEFGLTRHHVLVACWWIGTHGPWRWRRRWGRWAKTAHAELWWRHGRYETIPDPPWRLRHV